MILLSLSILCGLVYHSLRGFLLNINDFVVFVIIMWIALSFIMWFSPKYL